MTDLKSLPMDTIEQQAEFRRVAIEQVEELSRIAKLPASEKGDNFLRFCSKHYLDKYMSHVTHDMIINHT